MNTPHRNRLVIVLLLLAAGCAHEGEEQAQAEEGSHLKIVGLLYGQSKGSNRGRAPADEAAFREFLEARSSSFTDTGVDQLLVSERDGMPYVIVYGREKPPALADGMQVVAYEQQGVEGRIFVVNDLGEVREIAASELSK